MQAEQLLEIEGSIQAVGIGLIRDPLQELVETAVIDFHFQLLIEAVDKLAAYATVKFCARLSWLTDHPRFQAVIAFRLLGCGLHEK